MTLITLILLLLLFLTLGKYNPSRRSLKIVEENVDKNDGYRQRNVGQFLQSA